MYFGNSGVRKTWLDNCLKSALPLYPSTIKTVNEPKHCSNLNGGIITIFIDHWEGN